MTDPAASAARSEHRWPAVVAIGIGVALYALLPSTFLPAVRWTVIGFSVLTIVPLLVLNPVRFNRETRWSRGFSIAQSIVLLVANQVALGQLVVQLLSPREGGGTTMLLLAAVQVWATNVVAFATLYWELDRDGPVARTHVPRAQLPPADFRFPQDEDGDAVEEVAARSSGRTGWTAAYVDYLYFSMSNSMAFSPTDVMPLSHRAKLLMAVQAFAGFVILALVIARAVNIAG
ncbi:DUF1345 domain-containing protein [Galbitalea sp. SE-J8]|uniref:DUF1345 domain-containing protein n=1 Tax=Galbitalea sp. SE-J8 TaxID=3054952 RepID=UPI00259CEC3F|nr:DUF1345 domain-containing protein [Galbitalea sp. SE-J8]MDM4761954.1 DUF1345 domain-containing protein [Galbitalea sp. SE-J8]